MKQLIIILVLVFALFISSGCDAKNSIVQGNGEIDKEVAKANEEETKENIEKIKDEAKNMIKYENISPEEAKERLDKEEGIILLDVRTLPEYEQIRIPDSLLIPVDDIEKEANSKLPDKDAVIFVYCRSGRRSIIASEALVEMGYTNVYNLGGIIDWPYETEVTR